ncbi:ribonuclease BN [Loigolactobacillus backii]|uniref:YihY/virulence factor BrkB family protein n=1 Tax=Loigolactobacillus backii TaxID=375175 RepID=UPI000C5E96DB|nr:ribonuclease BN [Loigolactobacillus backii]
MNKKKIKCWQTKLQPIIEQYQAANISRNAVVVAYYALLSIFPLMIFLGNLLPLLDLKVDDVLKYIKVLVPASIYHNLLPLIKSFLTNGNGGLLSIGALVTLWSASKGIVNLRKSVNDVYGIKTPQNALISRIISVLLTLVFILIMMALVLAFGFGQDILNYVVPRLQLPPLILQLFAQLRLPVAGIMLLILLMLLLYMIPNAKLHFRCILPGAILTAAGWLILAQVFAIYVRYFASSVTSYGAIGAFIILMFWLDFIAEILLLSSFVNRLTEEHFYGEIKPSKGKVRDFIENRQQKKDSKPSAND